MKLFGFLVCAAFPFAATAEDLRVGFSSSPSLDLCNATIETSLSFDRLVAPTAEDPLAPAIAQSIEATGGDMLTVTLDTSRFFGNGDPVTSQDVISSFLRCNSDFPLEAVTVYDNYTFEGPADVLGSLLSSTAIVHRDVWENRLDVTEAFYRADEYGTGLYRLDQGSQSSATFLPIDTTSAAPNLIYIYNLNSDQAMTALVGGDLDVAIGLPAEVADQLQSGGFSVVGSAFGTGQPPGAVNAANDDLSEEIIQALSDLRALNPESYTTGKSCKVCPAGQRHCNDTNSCIATGGQCKSWC